MDKAASAGSVSIGPHWGRCHLNTYVDQLMSESGRVYRSTIKMQEKSDPKNNTNRDSDRDKIFYLRIAIYQSPGDW